MSNHTAVGPALGYYYQAIYALITLFDSSSNNACVSIETLDDVYHSDGDKKILLQLKHKTTEKSKISIKSDDLWRTIKVWCDHINLYGINDVNFTLSTVSIIDDTSVLNVLKDKNGDRGQLLEELKKEANFVVQKRREVEHKNINLRQSGEKEKPLPYETKFKGCEAFLRLNEAQKITFLTRVIITSAIFTIEQAHNEVVNRLKYTPEGYRKNIAEDLLAWWDRQAVKSLTRERSETIAFSEVHEFISKKTSEYYTDGFSDDLSNIELEEPDYTNSIHNKQLDIIKASNAQKKRSFDTEVRARLQRVKWIAKSLTLAKKLAEFDDNLVNEWSYEFEEIDKKLDALELESKGRDLLDWSHKESIKQINSISKDYNNNILIRGSYQLLSKELKVGWHANYMEIIKENDE